MKPGRGLFREARAASTSRNVVRTLAQTAGFWTVFLVLLPWLVIAVEREGEAPSFAFSGQWTVGVVVFVTASILGVGSGVWMASRGRGTPLPPAAPRRLVVSGPYAYVRNPMAVAGLAQGAGIGVAFGSWGFLATCVLGGVLWDRLVRPLEEADLARRFGPSFERYRAARRCWIPSPRPYRDPWSR